MLSPIAIALTYSISAGVMNGSFALPTKHIKTWNFENIWLNYSLWAFLLLPWLTVLILNPHSFAIYQEMPFHTLLSLIIGGFLFGAGQVCFALALRTIGLGLGFAITVGLSTALGSLLPLIILDTNSIFTSAGITTIAGVLLIMIGLLISYSAGHQRDKHIRAQQAHIVTNKWIYPLHVLLAIFAGLFSAGQNYTFALTSNMHDIASSFGASPLTASIIIWPPFLTCSLIPYAIYMLWLHVKNNSFQNYHAPNSLQNNLLGIIMAMFWFGSLAIYSKASLLIGALGPVIAWPLFMVSIIMTSNFWAWRHQEWKDCSASIKQRVRITNEILVLAVLVLTFSASLTH